MIIEMRSLGATNLYQALNGKNDAITKSIMSTVITGRKVDMIKDLPEAYDRISRYSFPNRVAILNAVAQGNIVMVMNMGLQKVPPFLPAYTVKAKDGRFVAYADLSQFATVNKDGKIRIQDKDLYAILSYAYITYNCYKHWNEMRNMASLDECISGYGQLLLKVMNRMFSLSANSVNLDKVLYTIHKFYMLNVLGYKNSTEKINRVCMKLTKTMNTNLVEDMDNYITDADYGSLETYFAALAKTVPDCSKLTQSGFMSTYVAMYGTGSVFSIEFLPTYLMMIDYVMSASYLTVNTSTVEKVIDKQAGVVYRLMNATLKDLK